MADLTVLDRVLLRLLANLGNETEFTPLVGALQEEMPTERHLQGKAQPDAIRRSAERLVELGWISRRSAVSKAGGYTEQGLRTRENGLPQARLMQKLQSGPQALSGLEPELVRFGLPAAKRAGWVEIAAGQISLTPAGQAVAEKPELLGLPPNEELMAHPPEQLAEWERYGWVKTHDVTRTYFQITQAGREALPEVESADLKMGAEQATSALDREMLLSGSWKGKTLRRYDVNAPVEKKLPARRHPISRLRENVRTIFLSMGFEEMEGPLVESAFWNFDALFQPQDHPARDLADTFYLAGQASLPDKELVNAVKEAHEKGWNYQWKEEEAKKKVLRTHTTAVSARTMLRTAKDGKPGKYFGVGKVFRNEATDYKHLAEFFQVEGIIVSEDANLPQLLGTLKEFYSKLGFDKIRFRPSYFPYTEPSLEIEVFHPARKAWLELGGAGILRPEVCGPLGGRYPVLAWGLLLERPLMIMNGIEDIRTFYRNDLGWLRNFPIA